MLVTRMVLHVQWPFFDFRPYRVNSGRSPAGVALVIRTDQRAGQYENIALRVRYTLVQKGTLRAFRVGGTSVDRDQPR